MINEKVEKFLESSNMNYLFCLLSNIEIARINQLPPYVKQKFAKKITEISLEHVAENEVPDYLKEIAEAELYNLEQERREAESGSFSDNQDEEAEEYVNDFIKKSTYKDADEDVYSEEDEEEDEDFGSGYEEDTEE